MQDLHSEIFLFIFIFKILYMALECTVQSAQIT